MLEKWRERPIPAEPEGENPWQAPLECGQPLVDITDWERVHYGAYYAGMGLQHALTRCYVRQEVSERLQKVLESLPQEYSLWIYDTLRPVEVQQSLYDLYWDKLAQEYPEVDDEELRRRIDDFVAWPRVDYQRPTPHSTGGAVDLTLMYRGQLLPMGTEFDDLTERANTRYYEECATGEEFRDNRRILYHAMTEAGFVNYRHEWWHYAFGDRAWGHAVGKVPIYSYIAPPAE